MFCFFEGLQPIFGFDLPPRQLGVMTKPTANCSIELLPETEMAVLCATMHLQPCGIVRLAFMHSFVLCFLKSSPLPMVSAGRAGDSAPGGEWLLAWFLLYLPTCDLLKCHPTYVPFQHQLQSPQSYHCTQNIRICACKKRIRRILFTSQDVPPCKREVTMRRERQSML